MTTDIPATSVRQSDGSADILREVSQRDQIPSGAAGAGRKNEGKAWARKHVPEEPQPVPGGPVARANRTVFRKTELHGTRPVTPAELKKVRQRTLALVGIVVHPESYIDQDIFSANVNFKSDSQVWLPYPWFQMPYMSVASELRRDNGWVYATDYKQAYNVYYIKTGHAVSGLPVGNYKTKGGHIAQAPPGYWPPAQTFFTETGWLPVY